MRIGHENHDFAQRFAPPRRQNPHVLQAQLSREFIAQRIGHWRRIKRSMNRDEMEVSREVEKLMHHRPVMLTGRTDLAQAVAVLSLADVLITNDTGPAHISAALNRPTLVIFGPTDPRTTRPFSPIAEIIRHPPECAPCMLRDCPIDHRCMTVITPDEVFQRASAMMKKEVAEVQT
jgi:ADP-heptose:LPS heptosyltransferase